MTTRNDILFYFVYTITESPKLKNPEIEVRSYRSLGIKVSSVFEKYFRVVIWSTVLWKIKKSRISRYRCAVVPTSTILKTFPKMKHQIPLLCSLKTGIVIFCSHRLSKETSSISLIIVSIFH